MNKKSIIIAIIGILIISFGAFFIFRKDSPDSTPAPTPAISLPINTIPVKDRPFLTLTPDSTGRSLELLLDKTEISEVVEYELVYQAGTKQEGVFGRLNLATEELPIIKDLLLGSRSAGGKTTYHEGVTGGSLTLTYGEIKLKEQFNFLRFDSEDPVISSSDARFSVEFADNAMLDSKVIVVMKTFGLPAGLPESAQLLAGPYSYLTNSVKGDIIVSIRLPAGEHINPTIYEYDADSGDWLMLETELADDAVSVKAGTGSTFIVTSE